MKDLGARILRDPRIMVCERLIKCKAISCPNYLLMSFGEKADNILSVKDDGFRS